MQKEFLCVNFYDDANFMKEKENEKIKWLKKGKEFRQATTRRN